MKSLHFKEHETLTNFVNSHYVKVVAIAEAGRFSKGFILFYSETEPPDKPLEHKELLALVHQNLKFILEKFLQTYGEEPKEYASKKLLQDITKVLTEIVKDSDLPSHIEESILSLNHQVKKCLSSL